MKKGLLIALAIILVIGIGGFMVFNHLVASMGDQVALQLENTPATPHKLVVDTSAFDQAIGDDLYESLDAFVPSSTIEDLQGRLLKGEITLEHLMAYYGKRIGKYDEQYNTVIRVDPNALAQARTLDQAMASGETMPPLASITWRQVLKGKPLP